MRAVADRVHRRAVSYELHVPAGYGLHVWETLLDRGADLGIEPFGVEAQRILRLEKGHLIVGQDTDGLTRGFSAGLDWAIKLDKDDFVGKPELAWQRERPRAPRLVGLQPVDGSVVPPEASQIVDGCAHRRPDHVEPDVAHPRPRRSAWGRSRLRSPAPGTLVTVRLPGRPADRRPGDRAPRSRGSRRERGCVSEPAVQEPDRPGSARCGWRRAGR